MSTDTEQPKSFADRLRNAAVEQAEERAAERRRVEEIILGANPSRSRLGGFVRLGEIVRLGDDYIAEVQDGKVTTWTTVVGGEARSLHHYTQEQAILHLIARRYDDSPSTSRQAAFYAARVLGIPTEE